MKHVVVFDDRGYKRRYLVRDSDGDENATKGIPAGPPDMSELDFETIKKEINNALADNGLFTWDDINNSPVGLGVVCAVIKRDVASLFKRDKALSKRQSR